MDAKDRRCVLTSNNMFLTFVARYEKVPAKDGEPCLGVFFVAWYRTNVRQAFAPPEDREP